MNFDSITVYRPNSSTFERMPTVGEALLKAVGALVEVGLAGHTQQRSERTDAVAGRRRR